jgi:argininosuccinate lyase
MPNKRNPDVIELLRAAYARCAASRTEIEQLMSLPSGYHRDLQFSKPAIVNAFKQGGMALALVPPLLDALAWVPEKLNASLDASMHATDLALELAQSGMPFRDAYQAAANPERWETRSAESSLQARVSPGGHAMPMLEILSARLQTLI